MTEKVFRLPKLAATHTYTQRYIADACTYMHVTKHNETNKLILLFVPNKLIRRSVSYVNILKISPYVNFVEPPPPPHTH